MRVVRWATWLLLLVFVFLIVNGWQHDHYSLWFVALIGVGLAAAWINGFMEAKR